MNVKHTFRCAGPGEVLRLGRREEREAQDGARIGFEDIVFHSERGDLLDSLEHPHPDRYGGRRIFVLRREDYCTRPLLEDEHTVFLKTIIPSRRRRGNTSVRSPTMKRDADEKSCLTPSNAVNGSPPRAAGARAPVLPLREGHVPQGPATEHPAVEQGPERLFQKRALAEGLPYQTLLEPAAQVRVLAAQRSLSRGDRSHPKKADPHALDRCAPSGSRQRAAWPADESRIRGHPSRQEPAAQKHRALPDPAFPSCQKWAPSFLSFTPP